LVIGPGINIKGNIDACDTLVVEGTVETVLQARRLEVRSGGQFLGEASVAEADIQGRFDGKLKVSGTLVLGRQGRIKGSTRYASLQVEKGGQLSGEIDARPVELSIAT
jgi:cytoskeletal protein CcmA (bactofilin family)